MNERSFCCCAAPRHPRRSRKPNSGAAAARPGTVASTVWGHPMSTKTQALASEKEARDVAEAARETEWQHPSFVRELFLGRFRLDLIHPHPESNDPEEQARAAAFLAKLRAFLDRYDADEVDRTGEIPEHDVQALREMGAFGIKIPRRVRRPGPLADDLHPRHGTGHLEVRLARGAALGEPVDRRPAAAEAVRHRRAEEALLPAPRQGAASARSRSPRCTPARTPRT